MCATPSVAPRLVCPSARGFRASISAHSRCACSRIAVWTDGKVTVLRNEYGEDKGTPTAVSFGDECLIGTETEKHLQVIAVLLA